MGKLADFLQSEADKRKNRAVEIKRKRDEWILAVRDLTSKLKAYADESNKDAQILQTEIADMQIAEEELGTYNAPELVITLDPRRVRVLPIARNVVGGVDEGGIYIRAIGRVDITDGARKYILYRMENPAGLWKVVDPDDYTVSDLDRAAFESILQELLG